MILRLSTKHSVPCRLKVGNRHALLPRRSRARVFPSLRTSRHGITVFTEKSESQKPQLVDCRDAYAIALEEMAEQDVRVCVVINDSLSSAKMKDFRAKYPSRFINVGIAEQNMVGVGNGL